jgi:hypothetical protein
LQPLSPWPRLTWDSFKPGSYAKMVSEMTQTLISVDANSGKHRTTGKSVASPDGQSRTSFKTARTQSVLLDRGLRKAVERRRVYMVTGQYDIVPICEAPDDSTLVEAILTAASQGSIVSETCRAFTEDGRA